MHSTLRPSHRILYGDGSVGALSHRLTTKLLEERYGYSTVMLS